MRDRKAVDWRATRDAAINGVHHGVGLVRAALRQAGQIQIRAAELVARRPLLEIKELLGHAGISMTMRYAHLAPGRLRDAVSCLDRVFAARDTRELPAEVAREVAAVARP
jgi:integrase